MSPAPKPTMASLTKAVVAICVEFMPATGVGAVGEPVKVGDAKGAFAASRLSTCDLRTRSVPPLASCPDFGTREKVLAPPTVWVPTSARKPPLPATGTIDVAFPLPSSPLPT